MGRALRFANTWCRPNSSKWFIKNVLRSTINQPTSDSPNRALAMVGSESCQMIVGIGRHCQSADDGGTLEQALSESDS